MNTGEKIKRLRQNNGLSQEQLAKQLNVSRQAITKWETNRGTPDIDNLKNISKLFNINLEYLVYDSNDEPSAVATESINREDYNEYKHIYKCLEDAIVIHKFPQAAMIYPLVREKKLSRLEKFLEWTIMPFFGIFNAADKVNNKSKDYLVVNNGKSLLVFINDNTITTVQLPSEVVKKRFTYGQYRYTKLDVEGISELISWKNTINDL